MKAAVELGGLESWEAICAVDVVKIASCLVLLSAGPWQAKGGLVAMAR